ncbi:ribokinase [Periweissella cryptocerci]|uniref:Ribokinase n=1 Tax=Periweissella cryptocerci TaxID=2506420 RepID=A0A4P6YV32_9LACO|nr:ribokinase [Periweissella cryptocerci]QBO36557.1 ribokinase [Periweissella cryptocerci]
MEKKVVVLGSLNVDSILHINHLPKQGETMAMNDTTVAPGGKGANQAVAAKRMGAQTSFIGAVGDDQNGAMMLSALTNDQVDTKHVTVMNGISTGAAYILLEEDGNNTILINGGTNQQLTEAHIEAAREVIENADVLITQFETPMATAIAAFKIAKDAGVLTILNPAPAAANIPGELMMLTDIIIPNETESEIITDIEVTDEASMVASANILQSLGVENVIITVGARGAFYQTTKGHGFVDAFKVNAVDTTAAGDSFIGSLAANLDHDLANLAEAIRVSNKTSSLAVQGAGALPSIPTREQVFTALGK